ncbi:hypothetical protein FO519_004560 [Halicephalobus sp. NKZ332]|nr:hypothetical protein FO519_004560 [Halicephalobus sp. NKZ332]
MNQCREVRANETRRILEIVKGNHDDSELENIISGSFGAMEECLIRYTRQNKKNNVDSFVDSTMYAITVFTTIGYGDLVAKSDFGRLLTIVYAVVGIPIYIAFISDLGDLIGSKITHFGIFLQNFVQKCWKKKRLTQKEKTRYVSRWLRFLMIIFSLIIFLPLSSLITKYVENFVDPDVHWSFIESFYFVFTTVTLIGFGDYLAQHRSYILIHLPFMIVGQTLFALVFYFIQVLFTITRFIRYEIPQILNKLVTKMNRKTEIWIPKDNETLKKKKKSRRTDETFSIKMEPIENQNTVRSKDFLSQELSKKELEPLFSTSQKSGEKLNVSIPYASENPKVPEVLEKPEVSEKTKKYPRMVNTQRLMTLPHALKPILVVILLISMISGGIVKSPTPGGWFFWLTTVIEFIFLIVVTCFFVVEIERLITCGRDNWPVAELIYSGTFFVFTVINVFITASWYSQEVSGLKEDADMSTMVPTTETRHSGSAVFTAIVEVALAILYGLGFFMMYKLWRNHVKSGATQNPTGATMPGNVEGMHPGI